MDELNYLNPAVRESIIEEINSNENKEQKNLSVSQYEIFKDRIMPFVTRYLERFYSSKTMKELPIIASVNLASRIIKQEARIYVEKPQRVFQGMSEDQAEVMQRVYDQMGLDSVMLKANQLYKLQGDQIHVYITLNDRQLKAKTLMRHQVDAVAKPSDPEMADAYVLSGFDKFTYNNSRRSNNYDGKTIDTTYDDGRNQMIGDPDDYKSLTERYAFWTKDLNFITTKDGALVTQELPNPIGLIPIVNIANGKDGEYWIRTGSSVTDATIQYNSMLTDLAHISRMQGFAQAYMIGTEDTLQDNVQVGTNFILRLKVDPNNPVTPQFGFASPNPDLAGTIQVMESFLSSLFTSRGLDPKIVNQKGESNRFSSGLERLLAMIEYFVPSKSDYDTFLKAEQEIFNIVRAYINTYKGTDLLDVSGIADIPMDATVSVSFAEPQMIETEAERLNRIQQMVELGVMSEIEKIQEVRRVDFDKAQEILTQINSERVVNG